jgi:hypothetical protein
MARKPRLAPKPALAIILRKLAAVLLALVIPLRQLLIPIRKLAADAVRLAPLKIILKPGIPAPASRLANPTVYGQLALFLRWQTEAGVIGAVLMAYRPASALIPCLPAAALPAPVLPPAERVQMAGTAGALIIGRLPAGAVVQ